MTDTTAPLGPLDCGDCVTVTAVDDSGYTAAAVRQCAAHKTTATARLAAQRAANPEVDAVHRMIAAYKART